MRIDAHHHLWRYDPEEYAWIDDSMQVLRRDFLLEDLSTIADEAGVQSTIAVQARQTLEETNWLLQLASESSLIGGVVGWAPICDKDFPAALDRLAQFPLLKGLRHVVQDEKEGFMESADFNRGIAAMDGSGLVYDLLVYAHQLDEATRFVDQHPQQSFVLDHIAKPDIANNNFARWNMAIRELARRDNVLCKISGMVTEARPEQRCSSDLYPYFQTVLESFGPSRLMIGSDWPVLTTACSYAQWWAIVSDWLASLSGHERARIEGGVAAEVYRLP